MLRAVRSGGSTITSTQTTIKTSDVGPIPQQLAARLVGFLEYGTALDHLDRLLAVVSPEELAVIEEIVKQRDEFIVYTNLSRRYEDDFVRAVKGDRAKHGLGWVMALARVEREETRIELRHRRCRGFEPCSCGDRHRNRWVDRLSVAHELPGRQALEALASGSRAETVAQRLLPVSL